MGVRMFERMGSNTKDNTATRCQYRVCQEGAALLGQFSDGRRIVTVPMDDFLLLLQRHEPRIEHFSQPVRERIEQLGTLKLRRCVLIQTFPNICSCLYNTEVGSCIFVCNVTENRRLTCCGWRGKKTCHILLKQGEKQVIAQLLGVKAEEDTSNRGSKIIYS